MRILVAVTPTMYRQTLAYVIRRERPDDEVRLADLDSLDPEASSFLPHVLAKRMGYRRTVRWVEEHPEEYARGISHGFKASE